MHEKSVVPFRWVEDVFPTWRQIENMTNYNGPSKTNCFEDAENYYVEAEIPGFTKDEVDVTVTENILRISCKKKEEKQDSKNKNCLWESFYTQNVEKSVKFSENIDINKLTCSLNNGILTIELPKKGKTSKKIPIK